jgi:hypothetical protein
MDDKSPARFPMFSPQLLARSQLRLLSPTPIMMRPHAGDAGTRHPAFDGSRSRYVSLVAASEVVDGWRNHRANGFLTDITASARKAAMDESLADPAVSRIGRN